MKKGEIWCADSRDGFASIFVRMSAFTRKFKRPKDLVQNMF